MTPDNPIDKYPEIPMEEKYQIVSGVNALLDTEDTTKIPIQLPKLIDKQLVKGEYAVNAAISAVIDRLKRKVLPLPLIWDAIDLQLRIVLDTIQSEFVGEERDTIDLAIQNVLNGGATSVLGILSEGVSGSLDPKTLADGYLRLSSRLGHYEMPATEPEMNNTYGAAESILNYFGVFDYFISEKVFVAKDIITALLLRKSIYAAGSDYLTAYDKEVQALVDKFEILEAKAVSEEGVELGKLIESIYRLLDEILDGAEKDIHIGRITLAAALIVNVVLFLNRAEEQKFTDFDARNDVISKLWITLIKFLENNVSDDKKWQLLRQVFVMAGVVFEKVSEERIRGLMNNYLQHIPYRQPDYAEALIRDRVYYDTEIDFIVGALTIKKLV